MKNWIDYSSEQLHSIPFMQQHGWEVVFNQRDILTKRTIPTRPPHNDVGFRKGNIYCWTSYKWEGSDHDGTRNLNIYWRSAKLVDNKFTEHKTSYSLLEVVNLYL